MIQNLKLKNYALKQKLHLSKTLKKDTDFSFFIKGFYSKNNKVVYDLDKQVNQIRKVFFFLRNLSLKKKSIFFFGQKASNLEKMNFINNHIFRLSFTIKDKKEVQIINDFLNDFFNKYFEVRTSKTKKKYSINDFNVLNDKLEKLIKDKKILRNGFFLQNWLEGSWSNIHCLKPSLDNKILDNLNINAEYYHILSILGSLYNSDQSQLPGAVIFFSREGYDLFFQEFKKLGVPVICIVGSNDSFANVDYPLIGDSNSITTSMFYINLIKQAFVYNIKK